ncbi:conserved hypothetical protein, partial [Perkinsus marinus ATCC 50983]
MSSSINTDLMKTTSMRKSPKKIHFTWEAPNLRVSLWSLVVGEEMCGEPQLCLGMSSTRSAKPRKGKKDVNYKAWLRHLAAREEMARSGKISCIIFIRDKNSKGQEISGYIDYGHRLRTDDFEAYFSREKRILPRPTDLCFYNWETQRCTANESPNFQVLPDTKMGLLFRNKRDRKLIDVNPERDPGDNSERHDV